MKLAEFSVLQSTLELAVRLLSSYRSDHERSEEDARDDDDDDGGDGEKNRNVVFMYFSVAYMCRT